MAAGKDANGLLSGTSKVKVVKVDQEFQAQ